MAALKKKLFVFGGFHDNIRDYRYFSDVHIFDTESYTWTLVTPSGTAPSPRSGCVLLPMSDAGKLVVYGGYSKEKMKKDLDAGKTFVDMYTLALDQKKESDVEKWKWQSVKQTGMRPSQRSGLTGVFGPGNKGYFFGGVFDKDEDDDDLDSHFFKDLMTLDLDRAKWFQGQLRRKKTVGEKKKRRRKGKDAQNSSDESDEAGEEDDAGMDVAQDALHNLDLDQSEQAISSQSDGVFSVRQSTSSGLTAGASEVSQEDGMDVDLFWPSPRMNTSLVVHNGVLYMYGGIVEEGDRQVTLADFYSLDLTKMDEWSVIIAEDRKLQEWQDSDDEEKDAGAKSSKKRSRDDDSDDDEDDDSDDSTDITFDDAPARNDGEGIVDYFRRSEQYWIGKAKVLCEEDSDEDEEELSEKQLRSFAKEICKEACS